MSYKQESEDHFVPRKHTPGEYPLTQLNGNTDGYKLSYIHEYIIEREDTFRIYEISRSQFEKLTAVYGADGVLKNIGLTEGNSRRFIYINIPDAETAENIVRHASARYGRDIVEKLLGRGEKARRLFAEYCHDEGIDYHLILATDEDVQKVWNEYASEYGVDYVDKSCGYGINEHIDSSGEYSHADNKIIKGDDERLSVILSCVPKGMNNECFDLMKNIIEDCVKQIIPHLDKTDDFKFISVHYD